jgi:hypothetical protein
MQHPVNWPLLLTLVTLIFVELSVILCAVEITSHGELSWARQRFVGRRSSPTFLPWRRTRSGTQDGTGAGDHDRSFCFGRHPRSALPHPFTPRQYARLLVLRSRYQNGLVSGGDTGPNEVPDQASAELCQRRAGTRGGLNP